MKDFEKIIEKAFAEGKLLSESDLTEVNGGDNPCWFIVEEGDHVFSCHNTDSVHRSHFHYIVQDRCGYNWWIHVTGTCEVCGMYNDYWIVEPKKN